MNLPIICDRCFVICAMFASCIINTVVCKLCSVPPGLPGAGVEIKFPPIRSVVFKYSKTFVEDHLSGKTTFSGRWRSLITQVSLNAYCES